MDTTVAKTDKGALVTVSGRFTTDEAASFLKAVEPLIADQTDITMNLEKLEFISSAGIRCMVMLLKSCQASGARLVLKNLTAQIKDIFTLTALLDRFEIE